MTPDLMALNDTDLLSYRSGRKMSKMGHTRVIAKVGQYCLPLGGLRRESVSLPLAASRGSCYSGVISSQLPQTLPSLFSLFLHCPLINTLAVILGLLCQSRVIIPLCDP